MGNLQYRFYSPLPPPHTHPRGALYHTGWTQARLGKRFWIAVTCCCSSLGHSQQGQVSSDEGLLVSLLLDGEAVVLARVCRHLELYLRQPEVDGPLALAHLGGEARVLRLERL